MLGAIIGGAMGLLGKSMSNKANAQQQASANAASQANAREQMAFQAAQNQQAMDYSTQSNATRMSFEDQQALRQMEFQNVSNAKQMDFQERMSSTAHQREVTDLKAAGLNPILSGTGGMGAATGSGASSGGAMASGASSPGVSSAGAAGAAGAARVEDILGPAVATAMQTQRALEELQNTRATTANIHADTGGKQAEAAYKWALFDHEAKKMGLTEAQINRMSSQIGVDYSIIGKNNQESNESWYRMKHNLPAQAEQTRQQTEKSVHETSSAKSQATLDRQMEELFSGSKGGEVAQGLLKLLPILRTVLGK